MQKRIVTSRGNSTLKRLLSLMRPHSRKKADTFLIEGPKFINDAINGGIEIITLAVSEEYAGAIPEIKGSTEVIRITHKLFGELSDTSTGQGIVAEARTRWREIGYLTGTEKHLVAAWRVQDPGNMGTIIRSCAAFGIGGVVVGPESANPFSPKTARASAGAVMHVPLCEEKNLDSLLEILRTSGYSTFWTGGSGSKTCQELEKTGPAAFFIGSEGSGFSEHERELIGSGIRIPMPGKIESLNAGVAASIIAYELTKR